MSNIPRRELLAFAISQPSEEAEYILAAIKIIAKQPEFQMKLADAVASSIVSAILRKVVRSIFKQQEGKRGPVYMRGPDGELWEIETEEDEEENE